MLYKEKFAVSRGLSWKSRKTEENRNEISIFRFTISIFFLLDKNKSNKNLLKEFNVKRKHMKAKEFFFTSGRIFLWWKKSFAPFLFRKNVITQNGKTREFFGGNIEEIFC